MNCSSLHAGKSMVKVVGLDAPDSRSRIGFLTGRISDDFESMGVREIQVMSSDGW